MKTDLQLQQDVLAKLDWDPAINATDIGVEAKDGIVTLSGHVASFAEKWGAERAARQIGVAAQGSQVRLTGVVPSWTDRNLACRAAWGTDGVHQVIDRMTYV